MVWVSLLIFISKQNFFEKNVALKTFNVGRFQTSNTGRFHTNTGRFLTKTPAAFKLNTGRIETTPTALRQTPAALEF